MKYFNTAGPVNQPEHYKLPPLSRWDQEELLSLIKQKKYFVLHAPRQTGKTSSMLALQEKLNGSGEYNAVYVNIEGAQTARNDVDAGIHSVIGTLASAFGDPDKWKEIVHDHASHQALSAYLGYLSETSTKPLVLFIDEIDALIGDTLVSVLRQLRAGYPQRPAKFPQSIILCGVRDIKDYRIHTSNQEIITGGSAFNVKAKSLTMGNFSREEVKDLLLQHTQETGQQFEDDVFNIVFKKTSGQPWLVNAIAYELTFEMKENRDSSVLITTDMVEVAINNIILSRATHLDQLADKLEEDRVRRVILPIILNTVAQPNKDDQDYCIDLGLVKDSPTGIIISNEIYQEVIPRELTQAKQREFKTLFAPDWINKNGTLDTHNLFTKFTDFWRQNSEIWASEIKGYEEAAPHLVFQAFLQRVANGGGLVEREYGSGRGRTDLMLKWRHDEGEQRVVIELKIYRESGDSIEKLKQDALEQTFKYADQQNSTENHIIIFDRDKRKKEWREKVYSEVCIHKGVSFTIWGVSI